MPDCYINSKNSTTCYGCEACAQICSKGAITMKEDTEGFRYPQLDETLCIHCGLCRKVCPHSHPPIPHKHTQIAYGGYHKNAVIRDQSTSGGAFSAIVESWCDTNYVIFGAAGDGLETFHQYVTHKDDIVKFRKSKYTQSHIGTAYADARAFLKQGRKVLFSETPCHIAALKSFLRHKEYDNLLTVEVVCEGVPSPLYIRKYAEHLEKKYGSQVKIIDYRYSDSCPIKNDSKVTRGRWDFEVMRSSFANGKSIKIDRWFNPFWSIWLQHLISRPSCYKCPFARKERNADITLGDLWGVHLYCPDLYGRNGGSSLIVCNSPQGIKAWEKAKELMHCRELDFPTALKYQGPMRGHIADNQQRERCMEDLHSLNYGDFNKKWAKKPGLQLLWQKYVWGNRQKIWLWNLIQSITYRFH